MFWALQATFGLVKPRMPVGAFVFDERSVMKRQREALQMIFMGKAGGLMAEFVKLVGDIRGIEFVPIKFELAKDLAYWSAEIPGKVVARAEALTGPTTPPGKKYKYLILQVVK